MFRSLIALTVCLFVSCTARSQNVFDVFTSLWLFDEGSKVMMKGYEQSLEEIKDSARRTGPGSASFYYREAIQKFNQALKIDPGHKKLGTYLSWLYYEEEEFDSALHWALILFPLDSVESTGRPLALAGSYEHLGFCYLRVGNLEKGNYYLQKVKATDRGRGNIIAQKVADLSDQVYYRQSAAQTRALTSRGIDPCAYSLSMLSLGASLVKGDAYYEEVVFAPEKLKVRKESCR